MFDLLCVSEKRIIVRRLLYSIYKLFNTGEDEGNSV